MLYCCDSLSWLPELIEDGMNWAILALSLVMAGTAQAQSSFIQLHGAPAAGPYTDMPTGMTFPASAAGFKRRSLTRNEAVVYATYANRTATGVMVANVTVINATWHMARKDIVHKSADPCESYVANYRRNLPKMGSVVPPKSPPAMASLSGMTVNSMSVVGWFGEFNIDRHFYCKTNGNRILQFEFNYLPPLRSPVELETAFLRGSQWTMKP
jgi:hypothetical protein